MATHPLLLLTLLASIASGCTPTINPVSPAVRPLVGGPIVIRNQHDRVYKSLQVSGAHDCLEVTDSSGITIETSEIGPCGGNGIVVSGSNDVRIYDSFIHPQTRSKGCCDRNDGVLVENSSDVVIQGNVIAYGESNVEAPQGVSKLAVVGNFLLNPRGPFPRGQNVQAWNVRNVLVRNNYTLSSRNRRRFLYPDDQEDSINFGKGSNFVAQENYVTGGHSASGCGLIADDGANNVRLIDNRVVNSGGCGIGIASGATQIVKRNRVINRNPVKDAGNTAIYVWNQYKGVACGPVTVSDNVAAEVRRDGTQSGFWNGGGCDPVKLAGNIWNKAAEKLLLPVRVKMPPPLIPPQPRSCVIESPYSTQTRWPACP
jgi:Right handed beta helix region